MKKLISKCCGKYVIEQWFCGKRNYVCSKCNEQFCEVIEPKDEKEEVNCIFEDKKGEVVNLTPELANKMREVMNKPPTPNEETII